VRVERRTGKKEEARMIEARRWTYFARPDYLLDNKDGTWTMGLLDSEGLHYECPPAKALIKKAWEVFNTAEFVRIMVDLSNPQILAKQNLRAASE
jgi:hypothetical protein